MRSLPFFSLLLTVFIDCLGFGLVFPILSPLIMNEGGLFADGSSLAMKGWIFGCLISTFCIGQFFGGPFLGRLSDRKGRKKILVYSLWVACGSYLLGGLGVVTSSITLIFISRLFSGIAAGNYAIAQSIIVDSTTETDRARNFGLINMAWGTGFIIGPYLGGKFSLLGFAFPFWIASFICLVNTFLVIWRLKETLPVGSEYKANFWEGIGNIKKGFKNLELRGLFCAMFIFSFGWGFFTEFSPLFLMRRFNFGVGEIANFYAYVGILIALCQGVLIRPILKKFASHNLLKVSWIGLALFLPLMLLCEDFIDLLWVLPFIAFWEAIVGPSASSLVSRLTDKENQGQMLGIHNSIQWAAIGIAPLFSGSLVALYPHLPVTVASIAMILSMVFFMFLFKPKYAKMM